MPCKTSVSHALLFLRGKLLEFQKMNAQRPGLPIAMQLRTSSLEADGLRCKCTGKFLELRHNVAFQQ
eukprot:1142476-Pelagomonas_calceolata.AAC.5